MTGARRCLFAALTICTALAFPVRVDAEEVLVFAAASLKTALDEVVDDYSQQSDQEVAVSYAGSSVLARQIQSGAPVDLFISANVDWMDVLQEDGLIDQSTRVDLLGNRLVLIGSAGSERAQIGPEFDLLERLNGGYLAMALVDAVPAGIYGKAAMQGLGLWDAVQNQTAQADNVRAALALVAVGASPLGIVYRSDAQAEHRVRIVGEFPADLHSPIIYPAALTHSARPEAQALLNYFQGEKAQSVFLRQGFTLPGG